MGANILVIGIKINNMDLEFQEWKMIVFIKDFIKILKKRAMESIAGQVEAHILANGWMIKCMEKVFLFGQMIDFS